jgi:hypothetical protein
MLQCLQLLGIDIATCVLGKAVDKDSSVLHLKCNQCAQAATFAPVRPSYPLFVNPAAEIGIGQPLSHFLNRCRQRRIVQLLLVCPAGKPLRLENSHAAFPCVGSDSHHST